MLSVLTLILAGCGGDTPEEIGAEPTTGPVEQPTERAVADTESLPPRSSQKSAGPMAISQSSSAPGFHEQLILGAMTAGYWKKTAMRWTTG